MNQTVWKYEAGDKKSIFGRPYTYNGTKWVPDEGGQKKENASNKIGRSFKDKTGDKEYHDLATRTNADLSSRSITAIKDYVDNGADLNGSIRRGNPLRPEQEHMLVGMDKAFSEIKPIDKPVTAVRVTMIPEKDLKNLSPGNILTDKGFSSFSSNEDSSKDILNQLKDIPKDFRDGPIVTLRVSFSKGDKVLPVSDIGDRYSDQKEIVVNRGSSFRVISHKKSGDEHTLEVEYVGQIEKSSVDKAIKEIVKSYVSDKRNKKNVK